MEREEKGYFSLELELAEGTDYFFSLQGAKKTFRLADPASRHQPFGIDGPSRLIDANSFAWSDRSWKGIPREDLVIYELHVGTFTREGTFESLIAFLDYLRSEVGINAIELMPVGQFSGDRNWGYDGVFIYAPQNTYGGPLGLRRFVDACHSKGIAVIQDVVYNHVGPEGNHLGEFGPYFSYKYKTPWGPALNYDERGCDEVRNFVVQNALHWIRDYHMDGLRVDAIQGIFDFSPRHILLDISKALHVLAGNEGRFIHVIAESDLNDPKVLLSSSKGGCEHDAQWADDFHHSVHAYLTGERFSYYVDFGKLQDIAKSLKEPFVYDGRYSEYRGRKHGASSGHLPGDRFVTCIQNHDQVGNRPDAARLAKLLDRRDNRLAAALLLLSQSIPLLFMGEEYGEVAPFYYFVAHSDKKLVRALTLEKKKEFTAFGGKPQNFVSPGDKRAFSSSKINLRLRMKLENRRILKYYRSLLSLRRNLPPLQNYARDSIRIQAFEDRQTIVMHRRSVQNEIAVVFVLGEKSSVLPGTAIDIDWQNGKAEQSKASKWTNIFDSTGYDSPLPEFPVPRELKFTYRRGEYEFAFPPKSVSVYSKTGGFVRME